MPTEIRLRCAAPPPEAAERLWDAQRHTTVIPLTTVHHRGRLDREGLRFVARTGLGPFGFDDEMVVRSSLDGRVVIEKVGRRISGTIEATLTGHGTGSELVWRHQLHVRGLGWAQPVVDVTARVAYAVALWVLLHRGRASRG